MVKARVPALEAKPLIGATMFGVTTPCVTRARERLEELGYEVLVFHQTGTGGESMEELMRAGFITGSLDVTTTELCDELVGGVLPAYPGRLEAAGELGLPPVVAVRPIIGAGAGPGLSAKGAEAGGGDLIIIYNPGRYRMAGRGSLAGLLPYGDANAIVVDMAREVLPIVRKTPVLAGVCGTDPFRMMPYFLRQLKEMGFVGVQNFPTVGLIDGTSRQHLEVTG